MGKKKFRKLIFLPVILTVCTVFGLFGTACGTRLDTPQNLSINLDNYTLSWSRVDNARGYEIEAVSVETGKTETFEVNNTKVSCSLQTLEEGDYEVRIRATSGASASYSNSRWSEYISVNKDYYSGCSFSLINNGTEYEVTGWTKPGDGTTDIVIPAYYRDKPVVGIAENSFKSKSNLTSVTVEGTEDGGNLRYVGKNAFYSCTRLEYVVLPDSVTEIGEGAFHSCRIMESFKMPAGVTEIGDSAFLYCRALNEIDLGNAETIGDSAFLGCDESLTELVIPDTVKTIGEKAFAECTRLETVTVGSGIESISSYAFQNDTALKAVNFKDVADGGTLDEIGSYAFSGCTSLETVTLPQGLETVGDYAFSKDSVLDDINIPSSVSRIGQYAFDGTALYNGQVEANEMFIYAGLDYAESDSNCAAWIIGFNSAALNLESGERYALQLSDYDEHTVGIADKAFYKATVLGGDAYSYIPSSVRYIGNRAFYGCSSLASLFIEGFEDRRDVEDVEIAEYAFGSMTTLNNFRFMLNGRYSGVTSIGDHAFYNDSGLSSVEIPSSVNHIGAYAFKGSGIYSKSYYNTNGSASGNGVDEDNLVIYAGGVSSGDCLWAVGYEDTTVDKVDLLDGTVGLADYAFTRDTDLQTVTGLGDVEYIGEGAFYKCAALSQASVPEDVEEIKPYTFYGCESLVALGSGSSYFRKLTTIGRSAFYNCKKLTGIDLSYSNSLERIGMYAFYGCTALSKITLNDSLTEIGDYAFYKSGLESITIPDGVTRIGERTFYKCDSLTSVDFGKGVESIGDYAFYKCEALEAIDIPGNVKEIGNYAFYKCPAVETLTLGDGVETIGAGAFASLSISTLRIPSSVREIGNFAFKGCSELKTVIIPSTVETIGDNAFYGISDATFYTDAEDYLPQWSTKLNSSYRPMVWGCTLSEDGSHVVSVKITSSAVENVVRSERTVKEEYEDENGEIVTITRTEPYIKECGDPEWEGHTFLGWSLREGGSVVYSSSELDGVYDERGEVTLYAVWD